MRISLLHPSYQRPELARKCYDEWMGKCDEPGMVEYVLCITKLDPLHDDYVLPFIEHEAISFISMHNEKGLVTQVNYAAEHSHGDLLIAISDDFGCPEHWDTLLREALQGKEDYIVKTQDGIQPYIMTLPMMDRKYYERFGYIYHPSYRHLYGDEELAEVGRLLGKTIKLDMKFPHRHYSVGGMKRDATNVQNDSNYAHDKAVFEERRKAGFELNAVLP